MVDPRTARLYVAEEDVGLWRFDARADGPVEPMKIAAADGKQIVADAEGVAIAQEGDGGYLVVSSQGDNAYAVYRLADDSMSAATASRPARWARPRRPTASRSRPAISARLFPTAS